MWSRLPTETASFPIFRHNGKPAEMVTAELAGAFEAPLYGQIAVGRAIAAADWGDLPKPAIVQHGQPDDTSAPVLLWDGEWDVTWVTFRDMGAAFGVALVGIYILVVMQFGSFRLPLVVLTPVPLTLIGILFGHWLFGAPFSATSMIGFIALAGIIVRNSILLVDFIRHAPGDGRPMLDVLLEAGAIRFKPILLTALAAMIGAVTILTDPIFQGLAISLLFGLLSSTILTVLVIPAIYVIFRGGRELRRKERDGMTNGSASEPSRLVPRIWPWARPHRSSSCLRMKGGSKSCVCWSMGAGPWARSGPASGSASPRSRSNSCDCGPKASSSRIGKAEASAMCSAAPRRSSSSAPCVRHFVLRTSKSCALGRQLGSRRHRATASL